MKQRLVLAFAVIVLTAFSVLAQKAVDISKPSIDMKGFLKVAANTENIPNPAIDMKGFLKVAAKAAKYRESRRLTEDEFIRMGEEKGVVILDARSQKKYDELHILGALNLSFPDITVDNLGAMLPDKNTTILIYCNNNFVNAEDAFPRKISTASLNLSTYISLYTYGYRNIYELGPLLDVKTTKLELIPAATVVPKRSDGPVDLIGESLTANRQR